VWRPTAGIIERQHQSRLGRVGRQRCCQGMKVAGRLIDDRMVKHVVGNAIVYG
jgi:hypothetical protein